jgi:LPS-assembly lipoprotein
VKVVMVNRMVVPALAVALAATMVSACGFRPLYGNRGARTGPVQADMTTVQISQISNRSGQILRNRLLDKMTPGGQPTQPSFRLTIKLDENKVPLGIRKDETATRANMIQTAQYALVDVTNGVAVDTGSAQSTTSYNVLDSDFGTIMSERDARRRGIELLAESITLRVALYFNRRETLTTKKRAATVPAIQRK